MEYLGLRSIEMTRLRKSWGIAREKAATYRKLRGTADVRVKDQSPDDVK